MVRTTNQKAVMRSDEEVSIKRVTRTVSKVVIKPLRAPLSNKKIVPTSKTKSLPSKTKPVPINKQSDLPIRPKPIPITPTIPSDRPEDKKEYLTSGFYCQDPDASGHNSQVNIHLNDPKGKTPLRLPKSFPPLPIEHGLTLLFETENDFEFPYDIQWAFENGKLDGKKRPPPYKTIRARDVFPERSKIPSDVTATCRCEPLSRCGESCINRIMSYLCGKECPCGDGCANKSLSKRRQPGLKIGYTGSRGFGLFAEEDIEEGEFVIDYRGEVISTQSFIDRINNDYKGKKNFYALAYNQDEVIDAGAKGNDARYINHGCDPNLEVRKYMTIGDGNQEFEVGTWATRKILKGEELFYNYNFDNFGVVDMNEMLLWGWEMHGLPWEEGEGGGLFGAGWGKEEEEFDKGRWDRWAVTEGGQD